MPWKILFHKFKFRGNSTAEETVAYLVYMNHNIIIGLFCDLRQTV